MDKDDKTPINEDGGKQWIFVWLHVDTHATDGMASG